MSIPDYEALADGLLEGWRLPLARRARRIAAVYAALYLEEPLLHPWCGLAALVSRHVAAGLETWLASYQDNFAAGNLAIYRDVTPAFLRFRAGVPVRGPLEPGFNALRRADLLARHDLQAAGTQVREGLRRISRVEQGVICQPIYDAMTPPERALLRPFLRFRMGWDTASPIVRFDGEDPGDCAQRLAWVESEVLPAWSRLAASEPARLRADLDRIRREGGVRADDLPPYRVSQM